MCRYLAADYRLTCDTETYYLNSALAVVASVVYIVGIPVFFYTVLRLNRDALHDPTHPDHKSVTARFGFLFSAYKPEAWWWEIVLLLQKLLLTGLIIFIRHCSDLVYKHYSMVGIYCVWNLVPGKVFVATFCKKCTFFIFAFRHVS